ncbi:RecQ-mediated genome instability protein 2 [Blattella germanica]|nr:RecQ-mediated genome instability protein 2 [Blattella germanica]
MAQNPAHKLFINDLQMCKKSSEDTWELNLKVPKLPNVMKVIPFTLIWIQGYIEQVVGKENEILILNDKTGKVKISGCNTVPGGSSWVSEGKYCSVVGSLTKVCALPEVCALKLTDLSENKILTLLWPKEVEELKLLILEQAMPKL